MHFLILKKVVYIKKYKFVPIIALLNENSTNLGLWMYVRLLEAGLPCSKNSKAFPKACPTYPCSQAQSEHTSALVSKLRGSLLQLLSGILQIKVLRLTIEERPDCHISRLGAWAGGACSGVSTSKRTVTMMLAYPFSFHVHPFFDTSSFSFSEENGRSRGFTLTNLN